jgi:hypothetical protein
MILNNVSNSIKKSSNFLPLQFLSPAQKHENKFSISLSALVLSLYLSKSHEKS